MRNSMHVGLLVGSLVLGAAVSAAAGEFVPLFDGKTLAGWQTAPGGNWEVKDGAILGTSPQSESRHGMLLSDKKYGDFVLKLKFKSLKGNSGLYFRAERVDSPVTVHLNGVTMAELKNDPGRLEGHFGLQLHGGNEMHVEFKDIQIKVTASP